MATFLGHFGTYLYCTPRGNVSIVQKLSPGHDSDDIYDLDRAISDPRDCTCLFGRLSRMVSNKSYEAAYLILLVFV